MPPSETPPPAKRRRSRRRPKRMGPHVYVPDRGRIQSVRWLSFILAIIVLFSVGPAVLHVNLETADGWARAVLLMAAAEAIIVLWMLAAPDWASVWVVMLVFGFVTTMYAVGAAVALATPLNAPMPLGMGKIRDWAPAWFTAVLAVQALATYLCGRASTRWHRMFELEMAGRDKTGKSTSRNP